MRNKPRILICGIYPPPNFGHSAMYKVMMDSCFAKEFPITFINMHFWTYQKHRKVTITKLLKMFKYYILLVYHLITKRPKYVFYNISFYRMPFLKDWLFCSTGKLFKARVVLNDFGQYAKELYENSDSKIQWLIKDFFKSIYASLVMGESTKLTYEGFLKEEQLFSVRGAVEDTENISVDLLKKEENQVRILFFSFLSRLKGVHIIFEFINDILTDHENVIVEFAGPVEDEGVEKKINNLISKYPNRVNYHGYISEVKDRTRLFRSSDIYVFPTQRDAFGLVLLHAMAEGIPVISSLEGNIPDIIEEGKNGYIVKKDDVEGFKKRIKELIVSEQLRVSMGKESRKKYEQDFTVNAYGQRIINAIDEMERRG